MAKEAKTANRSFERGGVYFANAGMKDAGQLCVTYVGRKDGSVTLAVMRGIVGAEVKVIEGREVVTFETVDGGWYMCSAATKVELDEAGAALAKLGGTFR